MSLIESQFELKTKKGENKTEVIEAYRVLVNFWHCIKIHVPNVLSCVSQVFPHYTKHDVSHSYAILDSIERILGEEAIKKLSVTDLWLLLCSAYYHDIGMYISGNEIKECFNSEEFKKYVFDLKDDTRSPLNKYASFYVSEKDKLNYDKCELTLDSYNSARFLLAAFFRDSHADRSENFLQSDSSVTEMFYEIKRLITVIAEICRLHCAKFEEVMKFSEVENGVNGTEDYCHPRFVACMLRIGDLLDFDSSRVSKSLLDHLSSSTPSDSIIHNKKNYCITHALVTPEKVDVYAECKEVEEAFEIDKWFTLIREEMSNQRNAWHDIASDTGIKGFPMCGKLETKLLGYEKIDNKLKAKFEIEGANAVKILQGSGIYKNKFRCIREILQNAIDATYLRIYLEKLKGRKEFAPESIEGFDDFLEICGQSEYQIEVRCKREEIEEKDAEKEGKNKNEKKKYVWRFEIQDHGIGIRKEDLRFLLKIGSGKNNKEKFDIIKKMPEYARPSGVFGIGFQSIFLITKKVNIKSRYAFSDEVIDVDVETPLNDGFVVLKTEKNLFADKGTIISFILTENEENYDRYLDYESYYDCFNESYDFVKNKKSDIDVARILEAVSDVSSNSYLHITCYNENEINGKEDLNGIEVKDEKEGDELIEEPIPIEEKKDDGRYKRIYQDEGMNLIVEIPKKNTDIISRRVSEMSDENVRYSNHISVLYRNEKILFHGLDIDFIDLTINILSGYSDDVLTLNRDTLKPEYANRIVEPLKRIIIQWLVDNWGKLGEDGQRMASMFIEYYGEESEIEGEQKKWKDLKISGIDFEKDYDKVVMWDYHFRKSNKFDEEETNPKVKIIKTNDQRCKFIGYVLRKIHNCGMYYKGVSSADYNIIFEKKPKEKMNYFFQEMDWSFWFRHYKRQGCRSLMPCFGYESLQIKEESIPENFYEPKVFFEVKNSPRTVCPYIVKNGKLKWDCPDEVVQWVYENRYDKNVKKENIVEAFKEMKKAFSEYVDADGKIIKKPKEIDKTNDITESKIVSEPQKQVKENAKPKTISKSQKQANKKKESKTEPKPKEQERKKRF